MRSEHTWYPGVGAKAELDSRVQSLGALHKTLSALHCQLHTAGRPGETSHPARQHTPSEP